MSKRELALNAHMSKEKSTCRRMSGAEQRTALALDAQMAHMSEERATCRRTSGAEQQIALALDAHMSEREEHMQTHERRGATNRTRSRCAHE